MAIQLKGGAQFLHVQKTGGSWIKQTLQQNELMVRKLGARHADYDLNLLRSTWSLRERLANTSLLLATQRDPAEVFRFCFVRHPLSWYESWWKYMQSLEWRDWGVRNSARHWHPNSGLNRLGSKDFNQFVRNVVAERPGYVSELFFSYTKPGISFIGKTENLRADLAQVLRILDLPFDIDGVDGSPPVNVSEETSTPEWDPKLRTTVLRLELPALVLFDYLTAAERVELGLSATVRSSPFLAGPTWRHPADR